MTRLDFFFSILLVVIGVLLFQPVSLTLSDISHRAGQSSNQESLPLSYETTLFPFEVKIVVTSSYQKTYSVQRVNRCEYLLGKVLGVIPSEHVSGIDRLSLKLDPLAHRGLGGNGKIVLRCGGMSDEEFVAVFIHEIGHLVDTTLLAGDKVSEKTDYYDGKTPVYRNDSSVQFYNISWGKALLPQDHEDFCSGYGSTDYFEDFAECYTMYVLHGNRFRSLNKTNERLHEKYEFLKNVVFAGKQYDLLELHASHNDEHIYDITLLPYSLTEFVSKSSQDI